MKKFIYIDSENVGAYNWYSIIKYLKPSDTLVLIYTENSRHLDMVTLANNGFPKCNVEFIRAKTGTPNALDFVLVSELTKHVISAPKSKHLIISNDQGYIPVIHHLREKCLVSKNLMLIGDWDVYKSTHPLEFENDNWII